MTDEMKTRLKHLAKMDDKDIKLDDIPEIANWDAAVRGKFYRPVKRPITIRLDADVLAWFKSRSEKYQSKINTVLREYVRKHA
jgi:uncharacterized protein (DUF4415 family)